MVLLSCSMVYLQSELVDVSPWFAVRLQAVSITDDRAAAKFFNLVVVC